jgi:predicted NodU family carbamoyl transferase
LIHKKNIDSCSQNLRNNNIEMVEGANTLSSGVPILHNSSLNEKEPIVNSPEEALACYLRTSMDMLVMENMVVERVVDGEERL